MSKNLTKLQKQALRLHTHTVVFKSNSKEETVAVLAQGGMTTNAIAKKLMMTPSEVQYRILKAQRQMGVRFRTEYRNGDGLARLAVDAIMRAGRARIQKHVAPVFVPLAAGRVNQ